MPRFHFDYRDGDGSVERDEEGIEFPSLEAACFDARLAIIDMWAEACRKGRTLSGHEFEIRDASGRTVRKLPFNDVLNQTDC